MASGSGAVDTDTVTAESLEALDAAVVLAADIAVDAAPARAVLLEVLAPCAKDTEVVAAPSFTLVVTAAEDTAADADADTADSLSALALALAAAAAVAARAAAEENEPPPNIERRLAATIRAAMELPNGRRAVLDVVEAVAEVAAGAAGAN